MQTNYENSYHKKCYDTYLDKNNTRKYTKNKKQTKVGKKTDLTSYFKEVQNLKTHTRDQLDGYRRYIDYGTYAKFRQKILKAN